MRLKIVIILALLLIPSLSWGGAASKLRGVIRKSDTSINGISSISNSGTTDTGTETKTGTGIVTVVAMCEGTEEGATVNLVINGATVDSLTCTPGSGSLSDTLAYSVSGTYSVRVYGTNFVDSTFSAGPFTFPQ